MHRLVVCREAVGLASAFLDGELNPESLDAVEWHLFECRDCSAYVAQLQATVSLLRLYEIGSPSLDVDVVDELCAAFARSR
jgi:anti-sigma factor RsiW